MLCGYCDKLVGFFYHACKYSELERESDDWAVVSGRISMYSGMVDVDIITMSATNTEYKRGAVSLMILTLR